MALRVLLVTLLDAAGERPAVGGVGASVVLHVTGPAEGGFFADEGVAVDGEGPVTRGGDDWWGSTAERASEGLDIGPRSSDTTVAYWVSEKEEKMVDAWSPRREW